jgi:hypothetical protein
MLPERWRPAIEAGDTTAISTALRVAERRARLLGLDAPVRQEADRRGWRAGVVRPRSLASSQMRRGRATRTSSLSDVLAAGRAKIRPASSRPCSGLRCGPRSRAVVGMPCSATERESRGRAHRPPGKTYTSANLVIAFFLLFPGCKIITTAPSFTADRDEPLGPRSGGLGASLPPGTGAELTETRLRGGPEVVGDGHVGPTSRKRFKGHHAENMLVVVGEAPGLRPSIYRAIEALRSGGSVRVLLLGNPTITSGEFYEAFTSKRRDVDDDHPPEAFDTPNLEGVTLERLLAMQPDELAANPVPNITTRQWVRDQYLELGADHPALAGERARGVPDRGRERPDPAGMARTGQVARCAPADDVPRSSRRDRRRREALRGRDRARGSARADGRCRCSTGSERPRARSSRLSRSIGTEA